MLKVTLHMALKVALSLVAYLAVSPFNSPGPAMPKGASTPVFVDFQPPPLDIPADADIRAAILNPYSIGPVSPASITPDMLWLARAMYSESKRPREQELVAWVIRNRLESSYLGSKSIQEVVLRPYQFSAFNPGAPKAEYYAGLGLLSDEPKWQRTLALARYVMLADPSLRPFSPKVRHFISPRSLAHPASTPQWALGQETVIPARSFTLDDERFQFFANVD